MQTFRKSPFNYIGGKYKLLPQLLPLFPKDAETFVDLFAGGLDIAINYDAKQKRCNDINHPLIGVFQAMKAQTIDEVLLHIETTIEKFQLSKTNKEGYLALRTWYNKYRNPLDLYVLICFSFNHQIRFNNHLEFNNPFGKDRSSFSNVMRANLIAFHKQLASIEFSAEDFRCYNFDTLSAADFVYADPPYLITCGTYNDGKRGFKGWNESDDFTLYAQLDNLNNRGIRFALSNVVEHKGIRNEALKNWMQRYNVHHIKTDYANSNYHTAKTEQKTQEVLITNY